MPRGREHYQVTFDVDEYSAVEVHVLGEDIDGRPVELTQSTFGPFDGTLAVTQWLVRVLRPMLRLPLG